MKAALIIRERRLFADGFIMEMVIWRVPKPVPPALHGFKYRFFYGRPGERLIGYDNERGKGDHRHYLGVEERYEFTSIEKLLDDFAEAVSNLRGEPI